MGRPYGRLTWLSAALSAVLFGASGCSTTLPSPPGRALQLATPASAGKGNTLVTGALFGGVEGFGPGYVGGEMRARHGVGGATDVGVSAMALGVMNRRELLVPTHAGIYAMRAFVHHELAPRFVAVGAGLAGGGSAGGGFLSPDVGLTLGYENPYAVPYIGGSFFVSTPLTKNQLELQRVDDDYRDLREPYFSFGYQLGTGARIPIAGRSGQPSGSIYLEFGATLLFGNDPADGRGRDGRRGIATFGVGYQAHFGSRAPLRVR
jgi:hypothetical protein